MNSQICENEQSLCNNVSDHVELQMTMKAENVTPNKAANLQNDHCKDKNLNSPLTNTILSFNEKELQDLFKSPFKSPKFNNREKSLQSSNITPISKVGSQKKRKINICDDNDIFNSELCNAEHLNDFEAIDMLHDLNFVAHFVNTKTDADTNAQETDENLIEVNKDPLKDPLSISDREEKDSDTTLAKSKLKNPVQKRRSIRLYNKQTNSNTKSKTNSNTNSFKKHKGKLNTKEKYLLEELENVAEQEEFSLTVIQKLLLLHVKLIHKVPPQHKIELTGAHAPTKEETRLFQKHGPLRKGSYSPTEDKIIRKNWNTFCDLHNWDPKMIQPFLNWRHNGKYYIDNVQERQRFVQFLANGLPWRTLYSVYSRFKTLYNNKITYTRYTAEEDEKILLYIENKHLNARTNKYIELAKLLKRTRRSIIKRYQYLENTKNKSKKPLVNIKWTLQLIKEFIKNLLSVTLSEDLEELKYATLPKSVWQKLEEKLNIHETVLKTFWQHQLHLQLFSTGPIYLNDIKIKLIEYMYGKGISNTREIIWPNVARHFEGTTAAFLCKAFFYLVQDCNMNNVDNFADVIEYLYHTKIPEIQNAPTDKFLPRIVYENEKIYILDENGDAMITTDSDDFYTDN